MTPSATRRHGPPGRKGRAGASSVRHDDRRRTFSAPEPRGSGEESTTSWWGDAWVEALEEGALDPVRLARGRAYAGRGLVDAITVTPGRITAYVHGTRPRPYRTQIRLRTLTDDEWDTFLSVAVDRPDHIAALLDKDVPRALATAADLLPAAGDLIPDCSCPDDGLPCKHAAALCYQVARLLDEDPFVLFLARGMGEREMLAALSQRNAVRSAAERASQASEARMPTLTAREALAPRRLAPLPPPFPVPAQPGRPPAYPEAPDPLALDLLATEAAARAHTLLTTGVDPTAPLTVWQDAVRLAAAHPGSGLTASTRALYRDLAAATGRTPIELARAVAAWRQGGLVALGVLEEAWDPPAGPFDRAGPALVAADFTGFRPRRNWLSTGSLQIRFGRDGLWYGYESEPDQEDWWPRGTPDADPVGVVTAMSPTPTAG